MVPALVTHRVCWTNVSACHTVVILQSLLYEHTYTGCCYSIHSAFVSIISFEFVWCWLPSKRSWDVTMSSNEGCVTSRFFCSTVTYRIQNYKVSVSGTQGSYGNIGNTYLFNPAFSSVQSYIGLNRRYAGTGSNVLGMFVTVPFKMLPELSIRWLCQLVVIL